MIKVCRRFPKRDIEQFTSCQILRARATYALRADASFRSSADLTYTILLERQAALRDALQSRALYVMIVGDLKEVVPLLSQKIQTVGVAIRDAEKRLAFSEAAALAGVARCVQQPSAMNIDDMPGDGLLPINRLIRWCRI